MGARVRRVKGGVFGPLEHTADLNWIDPPQNTPLPLRSLDQIARSEMYAKYMRRTKSLGPGTKWAMCGGGVNLTQIRSTTSE